MSVLRLPPQPAASGKQHLGKTSGAALSLAIAEAASNAKRFTLLLTADSQSAERLQEELAFFAPQLAVLHFPDWETLPYDIFSPHQDITSRRAASYYTREAGVITQGVLFKTQQPSLTDRILELREQTLGDNTPPTTEEIFQTFYPPF